MNESVPLSGDGPGWPRAADPARGDPAVAVVLALGRGVDRLLAGLPSVPSEIVGSFVIGASASVLSTVALYVVHRAGRGERPAV